MNDMHELCDLLCGEIKDMNVKIRAAGGKFTPQDLDMVDKVTHAVKSIKTIIAMDEYGDSGSAWKKGKRTSRDDLVMKLRELVDSMS